MPSRTRGRRNPWSSGRKLAYDRGLQPRLTLRLSSGGEVEDDMNSRRLMLYQVDEDMIGQQELARRLNQVRRSLLGRAEAVPVTPWPVRLFGRVRRLFGVR